MGRRKKTVICVLVPKRGAGVNSLSATKIGVFFKDKMQKVLNRKICKNSESTDMHAYMHAHVSNYQVFVCLTPSLIESASRVLTLLLKCNKKFILGIFIFNFKYISIFNIIAKFLLNLFEFNFVNIFAFKLHYIALFANTNLLFVNQYKILNKLKIFFNDDLYKQYKRYKSPSLVQGLLKSCDSPFSRCLLKKEIVGIKGFIECDGFMLKTFRPVCEEFKIQLFDRIVRMGLELSNYCLTMEIPFTGINLRLRLTLYHFDKCLSILERSIQNQRESTEFVIFVYFRFFFLNMK